MPACMSGSLLHTSWSDGIGRNAHVEEIVASASLIMIGHAAFHAAVEQYPRSRLTLRQGARGDPETARVIECTLIKIKDGNRSATEEKHGRPLTAGAGDLRRAKRDLTVGIASPCRREL
jgi:hypothetical protein